MINLSKEQLNSRDKGRNAFPMHETSSASYPQPIRNELRRLQRVKNPWRLSRVAADAFQALALTHNGEIVSRTRMQPHFFRQQTVNFPWLISDSGSKRRKYLHEPDHGSRGADSWWLDGSGWWYMGTGALQRTQRQWTVISGDHARTQTQCSGRDCSSGWRLKRTEGTKK